jgi:hypothetical protein
MQQPSRPYQRLWAILASATLAACVSATPASIRPEPPADLGTATGKTLFAIYLMGSDLEGRGPDESVNPGNGTYNLKQLLEGYEGLSAVQKANVDVLVAFGGSKRPGWEGMKVADLPALIADGQDGRFGNGTTYLSNEATSNMADPQRLQAFLAQVKQRAKDQGSVRTFVAFWDHGAAFAGLGKPEDPGLMDVPTIAGAFAGAGLKADMIGFDACLMANMEVAAVLKPHGRYLVASEELEPGRGWNYAPIIQAMGRGGEATTLDIGKAVVDSLIDTPEYQKFEGKTLSVLDLAKLAPIEAALADLSHSLNGAINTAYRPMLKAASKTRSYGGNAMSARISIDMVDYGQQLKQRHQPVGPQVDRLVAAVQNAVLYNRHDGSRPSSHGLSIGALVNPALFTPKTYNRDTVPLPAWLGLVSNLQAQAQADDTPPKITDVQPLQRDGQEGQSLRVVEDRGVLSVVGVHALKGAAGLPPSLAGEKLTFVLTTPAETIDDANDVYFIPNWDGKAFVADFGGGDVILPLTFDSAVPGGRQIYSAEVQWNGQKAEVGFIWDPQAQRGGIIGVRPYLTFNGVEVLSRDQSELQAGDTLAFYYLTVDGKTAKESYDLAPAFTIGRDGGDIRQVAVSAAAYTFGAVEDLKGNVDLSPPQAVTK